MLGERVVEALERRVPIGVGDAGERLGVAERRLLGLGVKLGLPPRGQRVDLGPGDARLARRLVVQVEAVGAVVELRDPQAQELGEAAVDPQVRLVAERIRAHPGHADQRLVPARVEPAVRDLDIVSHLGSFRCSSFACPRLPGAAPSRSLAIFYRFTVEEAIENGDRAYAALDHMARGK